MWWVTSSRSDAHLAPRLTRKVCQTVLFHHDLIGSARLSECCRTSTHRLLNVFQHLRPHWHLQLLSDFVTYTSCRQGRYQHPFDKEQTLFIVQLCLAVFRLDLVRKEQCTSVCTKITPVPLLNDTTKRQNWFLNCTRVEKHSNCSSFWKFVCHHSSSVMLESSSTCSVDFRIRQRYLFVLDTWSDRREAVQHYREVILCISLSPCRHGNDCHTHDPRFHVWIAREFSNCTRCLWRIRPGRSCFRRLIRFHNVHVFAFPFAFLVTLAVAVVTGGIVVRSSTWSPAVLRPISSSATVLARVDVCRARVGRAGRAMSFLVLVFAFALLLAFLVPFPADTVGFAPKFREE